MAQALMMSFSIANSRTEHLVGEDRTGLRTNSAIMRQAHSLWPTKTAAAVAQVTGYSSRAVENWDAGRARIPADALASLLQSEWGREFLAAVMANNEPRWWVKLKAFVSAVDVMTMQRITRRKLKQALDEEAASGAFAIPTAALFQDEDFYSGQPSPARSTPAAKGR